MTGPVYFYDHDVLVRHVSNTRRGSADGGGDGPLSEVHCEKAAQSIRQWPGYEPTPLRDLKGLAGELGVKRIYYKDESERFGLGSFKALGGAYAVSEILRKAIQHETGGDISVADLETGDYAAITRSVTVCCATDGNHGRSVAWGAQRFGCKCIIYIHKDVSEGRRDAIARYGADVIRVDGNYDDSVRQAAADAEANGYIVVSDTSYPGYLEIPCDVMRGYTVLADEALEQMEAVPLTHIFLQGGVGGFAAAIIERARANTLAKDARVVIVEPENAGCIFESIQAGAPRVVEGDLDTIMAGLACGEVSLVAFDTLKREVDDVLLLSDNAAATCMIRLADGVGDDTPFVAGESAVAGLAGMAAARECPDLSEQLGLNDASVILVIGTEGATDPAVYESITGRSAAEVETKARD